MSTFNYRENKYADHFGRINYGMIDIIERVPTDDKQSKHSLVFKILDHENTILIEKTIPLSFMPIQNYTCRSPIDESIISDYHTKVDKLKNEGISISITGSRYGPNSACSAILGDLPIWREYIVVRGTMLIIPLLVIGIPIVWILQILCFKIVANRKKVLRSNACLIAA